MNVNVIEMKNRIEELKNETAITAIKPEIADYSVQRIAINNDLATITDFAKFCEYGNSVNWCFTVNRVLLVGSEKSGIAGHGMTKAEYTTLNEWLTALSQSCIAYVSADMAVKLASGNKLKECEKLRGRVENDCFVLLKAIKNKFGIETPCTRWDIAVLCYMAISIKYRDRTALKNGYTLGCVSNITLLNKVLRLNSAVKTVSETLKSLTDKHSKTANKGRLSAYETVYKAVSEKPEKKPKVGGITRVKK